MPTLTVFTPAYNRAHTLERTYISLKNQNCKDFLWLIIDDGSTDNTKEMVNKWKKADNGFDIIYIYKKNGGMHTAHNVAYQNIHTELNVCIDSDDKLATNAVEKILSHWSKVRKQGYAGIIGLDSDFEGNIIGTKFPEGLNETTLCGFYANGGTGDKKLVYRTDVINSYPEYPIFEGEKYVALAYKYRLIDQDYKLSVINDVLCEVEYQIDGSSNSMFKQYIRNPQGFSFWRKVCMKYPTSQKRLFIDNIHYVATSIISKNKNFLNESPCKGYTVLAIPLGFIMFIYILINSKIKRRII